MSTAILVLSRQIRSMPANWQRLAGSGIVAGGLILLGLQGGQAIPDSMQQALLATLGTASATGAGALPVLFMQRVTARLNAGMLGFGAGVMLAATAFSLLLPGLDAARSLWSGAVPVLVVAASLLAGGSLLMIMDRLIPHSHFSSGPVVTHAGSPLLARRVRGVWLFVFAIALHNLPEGFAIGVAYGADPAGGLPLALGIGIQNLPEGLVVALALVSLGYRRGQATLIALATGLLEPLGGLLGTGLVISSPAWLPLGLAFAAGAMLYAVSHEVIPESHRSGHESAATLGLLMGFVLMMGLDTGLA